MKAKHKIKREILRLAQVSDPEKFNFGPLDTPEQIDEAYAIEDNQDAYHDLESEFRGGTVKTNIPDPWDRHYESKSVARQTAEGDWVGWTYWYGGGKHGSPSSVEWMEEAYNLMCHEEQKVVTVQTFAVVADQ